MDMTVLEIADRDGNRGAVTIRTDRRNQTVVSSLDDGPGVANRQLGDGLSHEQAVQMIENEARRGGLASRRTISPDVGFFGREAAKVHGPAERGGNTQREQPKPAPPPPTQRSLGGTEKDPEEPLVPGEGRQTSDNVNGVENLGGVENMARTINGDTPPPDEELGSQLVRLRRKWMNSARTGEIGEVPAGGHQEPDEDDLRYLRMGQLLTKLDRNIQISDPPEESFAAKLAGMVASASEQR